MGVVSSGCVVVIVVVDGSQSGFDFRAAHKGSTNHALAGSGRHQSYVALCGSLNRITL